MTLIRAILLDFDGVIKESADIKTDAFRDLFINDYDSSLVEEFVMYHKKNEGISRHLKIEYFYREILGRNKNIDNDIKSKASQFSKLVVDKVINSPYVDGIIEFINFYYKDMKFFIVSGTPQEELEEITKALGIYSKFINVFGSPKTKIDIINSIICTGNYKNNEVVMFGDAMTDYMAADYNDTFFIGRVKKDNLKQVFPINTLTITSFKQAYELIDKLGRESVSINI